MKLAVSNGGHSITIQTETPADLYKLGRITGKLRGCPVHNVQNLKDAKEAELSVADVIDLLAS